MKLRGDRGWLADYLCGEIFKLSQFTDQFPQLSPENQLSRYHTKPQNLDRYVAACRGRSSLA